MIEFSSVAMPISAPGGEQTLRLLESLDQRGQQLATRMASSAGATGQLGAAATRSSAGLKALREPLTNAARAMIGLNPMVAQLSSVLGSLAIGSVQMVGVLAGVAALGYAWNKFTEDTRKSNEQLETALKLLEDLQAKQRQGSSGPAGEAKAKAGTELYLVREEIAAARAQLQNLSGISPVTVLMRLYTQRQLNTALEREAKLTGFIAAGDRDLAERRRAIAEERRRDAEQAEKLAKAERERHAAVYFAIQDRHRLANQAFALVGLEGEKLEIQKAEHEAINAAIEARRRLTGKELEDTLQGIEHARQLNVSTAQGVGILERRAELAKKVNERAAELAGTTAGLIGNTVRGAIEGGFGGGLKAMGDSILQELGALFVRIGQKMLLASAIFTRLAKWLANPFSPGAGIGMAIGGAALIALGTAMSMAGSGGGGSAGGAAAYSAGGSSASLGAQMVSVTPYAAPNMSGVAPAKPVTVNATFIGKHDATAGRELLEMIEYHQRTRRS